MVSLEERAKDQQKPFLEQLVREGARKLLQAAIENEVIEYVQIHNDRLNENGQRLVVHNGHLPEREMISGAVGFQFVSHGSAIGTRGALALRFRPSICVEFPVSMP
jgi:hypothetical protein